MELTLADNIEEMREIQVIAHDVAMSFWLQYPIQLW